MSHYFLIATLTAVIASGIAILSRNASPKDIDGCNGVITPGKTIALITVGGGIFMMVAPIGLAITDPSPPTFALTAMLFLLGGAIAGFMSPSLTSMHDVSWNESSLTGPAKMFGPTLGTKRSTIAWPEIVKTGKTFTGYWFVEAADGRRIYWSYLYNGYGKLTEALKSKIPSVRLPNDLS